MLFFAEILTSIMNLADSVTVGLHNFPELRRQINIVFAPQGTVYFVFDCLTNSTLGASRVDSG